MKATEEEMGWWRRGRSTEVEDVAPALFGRTRMSGKRVKKKKNGRESSKSFFQKNYCRFIFWGVGGNG
jgi:hypothetical protein